MNAPIKVGDQLCTVYSSSEARAPHVPLNSTCADREAWLDRAEHDLAAMRLYLAELEQRWAGIKSEFGVLATVAETSNTAEQQKRSA